MDDLILPAEQAGTMIGAEAETPPEEVRPPIGVEEIRRAGEILEAYRQGKAALDKRIKDEEIIFLMEQYKEQDAQAVAKAAADKKLAPLPTPVGGWLTSSVINKQADMMDNMPTVACFPREQDDEPEAEALTSILPVVLDRAHFRETYSLNAWYGLKHGIAAFGAFWNPTRERGIGDISITKIDVLNLFWDMTVTDIQESRNLFILSAVDRDILRERYPQYREKHPEGAARGDSGRTPPINAGYLSASETADGSADKALVVDWYYKRTLPSGRVVLHYVKYTDDVVLFASENLLEYAERGWYDHGEYPVQIARVVPQEGTCAGYGLIFLGRGAQEYIDRMDNSILRYVNKATRRKWYAKKSLGINLADFEDDETEIVEVEGDIDEEKLRQATMSPIPSEVFSAKSDKVTEMKESLSNRDVSQGSTSGGVTAAAALAILNEAGNKVSRAWIGAYYDSYERLMVQVVELIRQFYTDRRSFRIEGADNKVSYIPYTNKGLADREIGVSADGEKLYRRVEMDLRVKAAKQSPWNQLSQNELMKELYKMGVFEPSRAQGVLGMLKGMDFPGIEQVREYVQNGQTLQNQLSKLAVLSASMLRRLAPTADLSEFAALLASQGVGEGVVATVTQAASSPVEQAVEGGRAVTERSPVERAAQASKPGGAV